MQEENKKASDELIDVGETTGAEINLDDKGEPEKVEAPQEEQVEVEQVEQPVETKTEEKKDELKEYSDGVQKRISKLTRKMREAERQREEAVVFAESIKRDKEALETRFSKLDKSYVSEFESRVTTNMTAARQALKTSIEAADVDGQVAAQEQIARLNADAIRLSSLKAMEEEEPKKVNITPQRQVYQPNVRPQTDEKAEDWAAGNSWFGNDSAMTYTAFDIHKSLVEKEGYDPKS